MGLSAVQNAASARVSAIAAQPIPGIQSRRRAKSWFLCGYAGPGPSTLVSSHPANGVFPNNLAGTAVLFDSYYATVLRVYARQRRLPRSCPMKKLSAIQRRSPFYYNG